jgi:hypothetical protein
MILSGSEVRSAFSAAIRGSAQGRENLALGFGSIGTLLPHLMQITTRRTGRREIKPTWPQVHVSRTSTGSLYAGGSGGQRAICSVPLTPANAGRLGEGRRAWTPNHLHQR